MCDRRKDILWTVHLVLKFHQRCEWGTKWEEEGTKEPCKWPSTTSKEDWRLRDRPITKIYHDTILTEIKRKRIM